MNTFTCLPEPSLAKILVDRADELRQGAQPRMCRDVVLAMLFFNSSLRTRVSTQRAAINLGAKTIDLDLKSTWNLEFGEGALMDQDRQEHIKDAVRVLSGYCDILGVRTFAGLQDQKDDYSEPVMRAFQEYTQVPLISLESATLHPLQSLADMITIRSFGLRQPKIAVTWAPHPRALPQAVTNSFLQWVSLIADAEVVVAHPKGYELNPEFTRGFAVTNYQQEAFAEADIVYCKNWSSYSSYGETPSFQGYWTVNEEKMALTNNAKFMHCLPIRRNVVATDAVIDQSAVYAQALNRVWSAQAVIESMVHGIR